MANELVGSVTATPTGPVTIGLGQTLDISASFTLNGPPPGSPTSSTYTLLWQKVGLGASLASESGASAGTVYTKTISAVHLPIGTHQFKVEGAVLYDPFDEQYVDSNLITVHVAGVREIDAELPERTATVGLPSRESEAELPLRSAEVGLPDRTNEAELPNRSATVGLP